MVKGTWLQLKNEVAGTEDEDACCHSGQSLTHGKRLTREVGPWRWLGPRVAHGVPSERLAIEGWFRSFMTTIYLSFWALCL